MKHIAMSNKHKERRVRVIERLEAQLVKKTKNSKEPHYLDTKVIVFKDEVVPLTESDIKRINKEIETLKTRI